MIVITDASHLNSSSQTWGVWRRFWPSRFTSRVTGRFCSVIRHPASQKNEIEEDTTMTLYPCLKISHLRLLAICLSAAIILKSGNLLAQSDPGPRAGAAGAGRNYSGLNSQEITRFVDGLGDFQEIDSVSG